MRLLVASSLLGLALVAGCHTPPSVDAGNDAMLAGDTTSALPDASVDAFSGSEVDASSTAPTLTMNDVSVLWPLPSTGLTNDFIAVTASGAHGPLLPSAAYTPTLIPPLVSFGTVTRDSLRVVAMRIDPCFRASITSACQPMIRLVAQPTSGPDGMSTGFADAAIHLHYAMPDAELRAFALEVANARRGAHQAAPFGVHPVLEAEGLTGTFANTLRTLILAHLGEDRLSRITFTTRTNSRTSQWEFGRVDRMGATWARVNLDTVVGSADLQTLTAGILGTYGLNPETTSTDALTDLYTEPASYASVPMASRQALLDRAYAVLNPERHTAESIDCSSCHIATHVARDASAAWPGTTPTTRFESTLPLSTPTAPLQRDHIRAFGYFDRTPEINQRTINETAATLEALAR